MFTLIILNVLILVVLIVIARSITSATEIIKNRLENVQKIYQPSNTNSNISELSDEIKLTRRQIKYIRRIIEFKAGVTIEEIDPGIIAKKKQQNQQEN